MKKNDLTKLIVFKNNEWIPLGDAGPSILDFGFIHSDATYDVIPVMDNRAFYFWEHIDRFKNSARKFNLPLPDVDYERISKELLSVNCITDAFIWLMIWRGMPLSGNPRDIKNTPCNFVMYAKQIYSLTQTTGTARVFLDRSSVRVSDLYYGQTYKNMSWIDLTQAQLKTPENYDTIILVDKDDYITEGPGFNVAIIKNGIVKTPKFNCLQGITILSVEHICHDFLIPFSRCNIHSSEWDQADEIFLASSSGGITIVKEGPITKNLQDEYNLRTTLSKYTTNLI
jgi:branched-chain amino acid aminotransferase